MSTESDFEGRFAAVLGETMRTALSETKSLYESLLEELQTEMRLVKRENEALRSKYNRLTKQRRNNNNTASQCDSLHLPAHKEVSLEQQEKSPSLVPEEQGLVSPKTEHVETPAVLEECGDSQPSGDDQLLFTHCSETDSADSDGWEGNGDEWSDNSQNVEGLNKLSHDLKLEDTRTHTGENPLSCTFCKKVFHNSADLDIHMKIMKIHRGEKPFICAVCDKGWYQKSHLTKHMKVHRCSKPLSCKVCGKIFSQGGHLKMHMKIHTRVIPFSCTLCGKIFCNRVDVRLHMAIHTRDKRFICTVCGKGWHHKRYLTTHIRVHTANKPFGCTVCGKGFKKNIELKKHIEIHSKKRDTRTRKTPHKVFSEKPFSNYMQTNDHSYALIQNDHSYALAFPC